MRIANLNQLRTMPQTKMNNCWTDTYVRLVAFQSKAIDQAPSRIAELKKELPPLSQTQEELFKPIFYTVRLEYYAVIDVIMQSLSEEGKLLGLELGANYGPYQHYLKQEKGFSSIWGIDIDPAAIKYAGEIGSPIINASADAIPFANGVLDVVFSYHFLDINYTKFIGPSAGNRSFTESVLREIMRILKLGGVYISSLEIFDNAALTQRQQFFGETFIFSEEVRQINNYFGSLYIFRKSD